MIDPKEFTDPNGPSELELPYHQYECLRVGCHNRGDFRRGLCLYCYKSMRSDFIGERLSILKTGKYEVGELVLISQAHPNRAFRGRYATVTRVEDDGFATVVKFTGLVLGRGFIREILHRQAHVPAVWLLGAEA